VRAAAKEGAVSRRRENRHPVPIWPTDLARRPAARTAKPPSAGRPGTRGASHSVTTPATLGTRPLFLALPGLRLAGDTSPSSGRGGGRTSSAAETGRGRLLYSWIPASFRGEGNAGFVAWGLVAPRRFSARGLGWSPVARRSSSREENPGAAPRARREMRTPQGCHALGRSPRWAAVAWRRQSTRGP
jgi:hypothetical protein